MNMATISASSSTSIIVRSFLVNTRVRVLSSPVLGLRLITKNSNVVYSMEAKPSNKSTKANAIKGASSLATIASIITMWSNQAVALVDDRMSTEGTGLPFGLSNGLLGWILLGVFALIWSLYFVYTSSLDEDEDSGLCL